MRLLPESRVQELLAVASAEVRSARRLVRTWLFLFVALFLGVVMYGYYTFIHTLTSGHSASVGFLHPRFILASFGFLILFVLVVALVFLAFDVRARDVREHMAEVLDARPCSNFMLLLGRLAGLVFVAWLPLAVLVALIQGVGTLAVTMEWRIGDPVEPVSLLVFLLLDVPATLALWGAIVMCLAAALRNRLLVLLVVGALLAGYWWLIFSTPIYVAPAFAIPTDLASDVLPGYPVGVLVVQRLALLAATGGLLFLAATFHARADDRPAAQGIGLGVGLLALAAATIGAIVWRVGAPVAQQEQWLAIHQASEGMPRADVRHLAGQVAIEPGERLGLDLTYRLAAASGRTLFTLNPGMTVTALRVDGADAPFEHADGLLAVDLPPTGADEVELAIVAEGVPDPAFAYLDSALRPALATGNSGLVVLGMRPGIFASRYVALMPGLHWLPSPGAATGRDKPANYGRDFFTLDLAVQAPAAWLVAGPGKREGEAGAFRFRPPAPVPEVGLIGAAFERRAMVAGGVELELLMHPKHLRNVAFFAEAAPEIEKRATRLFAEAERMGLGYPYGALSLVEVPAVLRPYGGGWRMGSVQALPGVLLLREYSFPTARFGVMLDADDEYEMAEGGRPAGMVDHLTYYFGNDVTGGSPMYEGLRNLHGFLAGAQGEGAPALDLLVHELTAQLVAERRGGYFSAHDFETQADLGNLMNQAMGGVMTGQATQVGRLVYDQMTSQPSVWNRALGASLAQLDVADPRLALRVLWLKCPPIAASIIAAAGRERTAALLAELRQRHVGGNFTAADFEAAASVAGVDIRALLGDWLRDAALPGFVAANPEVFRLADDDQGQPRYQLSVHVRNDEPVPGLVRLTYGERAEEPADSTGPIRIPGNSSAELGLVASSPPARMWLEPYLSLNRRGIELAVPTVDEEQAVAEAPFAGERPSDWRPVSVGVVVDDLDAGFKVRVEAGESSRLGGGSWFQLPTDMDEGLPAFSLFVPATQWSRQAVDGSWGKYRRTVARIGAGDGAQIATFEAQLPAAGRWRLGYHLALPPGGASAGVSIGGGGVRVVTGGGPGEVFGSYDLRLQADGVDTAVEFDAIGADTGWNQLGDFDLPAGSVTLSVTNKTSGRLVVADAIRWRPVAER